MHQVGDQKVRVEVLVLLQTREQRIVEQGVVLKDREKREFPVVLVVPFRADDVTIDYAGVGSTSSQSLQKVGVIDGERVPGAHGDGQVKVLLVRQERSRTRGRIEVNCFCGNEISKKAEPLQIGVVHLNAPIALVVIGEPSKRIEIRRGERLMSEAAEDCEVGIGLQDEGKPRLVETLELIAVRSPQPDVE